MYEPQIAFIETEKGVIQIELPDENDEVLPNTKWGNVAGFPTVAYWFYRVLERRLKQTEVAYKLGDTLLEEVGACLLGGHGIPAENGLAAYHHMKSKGAFTGKVHNFQTLHSWLSEPIRLNGKTFKYRFAKQKASYIHSALIQLSEKEAPSCSGLALRNWLIDIKGVGLKTASWIARNWLNADDVAILDIHIYRAGILGGFFDEMHSVERHYLELEKQFIQLSKSMSVRPSELDALMWFEMQQTPTVLKQLEAKLHRSSTIKRRAKKSHSNTKQMALI